MKARSLGLAVLLLAGPAAAADRRPLLETDLFRFTWVAATNVVFEEDEDGLAVAWEFHTETVASVLRTYRDADGKPLARALVTGPRVLLADEPTGNLDKSSGEEILGILRRLNREQNLTIVMVTHDGRIAAAADRTVTLVDGRVVAT